MRYGQRGQGSVEYALVLLAFLSMLVALSALWHAGREGMLLERAVEASSHSTTGGVGLPKDVLLY